MKLTLTRDAEEFAARTSDLFESRIECNLIATVCAGVLAGRYLRSAPLFAYGTENGETRFAALRTPPWDMLVTDLSAPIEHELVARWLAEDPAISGVEGPAGAARAVASAWARETRRDDSSAGARTDLRARKRRRSSSSGAGFGATCARRRARAHARMGEGFRARDGDFH